MVYVNDLSTGSDIFVRTQQHNFSFPCVYSVQVSAVNTGGEGERSSTTTINNCVEGDNTADNSGQTVQEESDYYHNQTFSVYDQEVTLSLVGSELENTTENLHSQDTLWLDIMIGTIVVTGSIASVSLGFNCVLLTLLMKSIKKSKNDHAAAGDMGKYEQKVIMEQNEAYACVTSLNPTYDTICATN